MPSCTFTDSILTFGRIVAKCKAGPSGEMYLALNFDTSFKRHPIHKSCVTTLPIQISKLHILLEPIIQNSAYLLCKLPCCLHCSISRHRRRVSILENDKWLPLKPISASILLIAPDYLYRQAHSNVPLYS